VDYNEEKQFSLDNLQQNKGDSYLMLFRH